MGLRSTLHRLLGRADAARTDTEPRGTANDRTSGSIEYIELPGSADWEDAAALVVAEDGAEYEFPLPDDVADPTRPVRILFGGSSDDPNALVWDDPPDVTPRADFLIRDADGNVRPIPETERRGE